MLAKLAMSKKINEKLEEYNKSFKLIVLLCISYFFCLTIKDKKYLLDFS